MDAAGTIDGASKFPPADRPTVKSNPYGDLFRRHDFNHPSTD